MFGMLWQFIVTFIAVCTFLVAVKKHVLFYNMQCLRDLLLPGGCLYVCYCCCYLLALYFSWTYLFNLIPIVNKVLMNTVVFCVYNYMVRVDLYYKLFAGQLFMVSCSAILLSSIEAHQPL